MIAHACVCLCMCVCLWLFVLACGSLRLSAYGRVCVCILFV